MTGTATQVVMFAPASGLGEGTTQQQPLGASAMAPGEGAGVEPPQQRVLYPRVRSAFWARGEEAGSVQEAPFPPRSHPQQQQQQPTVVDGGAGARRARVPQLSLSLPLPSAAPGRGASLAAEALGSVPPLQLQSWPAPAPPDATHATAQPTLRNPNSSGGKVKSPKPPPIMTKLDLSRIGGSGFDDAALPLSEHQLRTRKMAHFDKQCSPVAPGVFVSGDTCARNLSLLKASGITHVLNCAGNVCLNHFPDNFTYKTFYLRDSPHEDLMCVLYDGLEFIAEALQSGGAILVHCSHGVSRSSAITIAYIMYTRNLSYDEAYAIVKEGRGVANPNVGFACQLMQWQRLRSKPLDPDTKLVYQMKQQGTEAQDYYVPKLVAQFPERAGSLISNSKIPDFSNVGSQEAFLIHTQAQVLVWKGTECPPVVAQRADESARNIVKYDRCSS